MPRMISGMLLGVIALVVAVGCKPNASDTSQVQSLDELANGKDDSRKVCEGKSDTTRLRQQILVDDSVAEARRSDLRASALRGASAVPKAHLDELLKLGVVIRIGGKPSVACIGEASKGSASKSSSKVAGEYFFTYDATTQSFACLEIVLPVDSPNPGNALVRTIGYLYSQVFSQYSLQGGSVVEVEPSEGLMQRKIAMVEGFLVDMRNSKKDFEALASYFSKAEIAGLTKALERDDASGFLASAGVSLVKALGFADFIVAEGFDSQHCSDATRKGLGSFPKTVAVLKPFLNEILDHSKHETENAMGLWWGSGSGSGYTYYPSYAGQRYGQSAGYGPYGRETYRGSWVGPNSYYNVYSNSAGTSRSSTYSSYGYGGYGGSDTLPSAPSSVAPNMIGD